MIKTHEYSDNGKSLSLHLLPKKKNCILIYNQKPEQIEGRRQNYLNSNFNSMPNNSANRIPFPLN